MFNIPFYGFPNRYPYYYHYNKNFLNLSNKNLKQDKENSITNSYELSNTINSTLNTEHEQPIFEILGIKLFLDDLIILGLLIFLYQQNVKDEMLYIILFLLLFS